MHRYAWARLAQPSSNIPLHRLHGGLNMQRISVPHCWLCCTWPIRGPTPITFCLKVTQFSSILYSFGHYLTLIKKKSSPHSEWCWFLVSDLVLSTTLMLNPQKCQIFFFIKHFSQGWQLFFMLSFYFFSFSIVILFWIVNDADDVLFFRTGVRRRLWFSLHFHCAICTRQTLCLICLLDPRPTVQPAVML